MVNQTDDERKFWANLETEVKHTIKFLVESVLVHWSSEPDEFFPHTGGFGVTLNGAFWLGDFAAPTIKKHLEGKLGLHRLSDSGYSLNQHGQAILGALVLTSGGEIEAHLFLPADDLRSLATLLPTAVREESRVMVWMHPFASVKEWDAKGAVGLARTSIVIGALEEPNLWHPSFDEGGRRAS